MVWQSVQVTYLEFLKFVKGDEQVAKEARAALRVYMLREVFKVHHGSEVQDAQVVAVFKHFDTNGDG